MVKGKLVLENGDVFEGDSFGFPCSSEGEVVFNTGMVGYPESLTDPSYRGQILCLTYPLIGNYGVPNDSKINGISSVFESSEIHASGLIVSEFSKHYSHWSASKSLSQWLREHRIPALEGIDTRELTKVLRERGTMAGKLVMGKEKKSDEKKLIEQVSVKSPVVYRGGKKTVVLVDCGVKNNIIRSLLARRVTVIRVPWDYDFFQLDFDGILISNGPGDPKDANKTIAHISEAMEKKIPTFGICLGNQILALAAGGETYKMKYGHRSQNQPCVLNATKKCFLTSQNHGYAVDYRTLGKDWNEWFVNLNDGTNEGLMHASGKFFSVQFHPEASPGPTDTSFLFDKFLEVMK